MEFSEEFWSELDKAPGWCWREKAEYIYRMGTLHHIRTAVEIGVYGGRSFLPLAAAMFPRGARCIGYDVYQPHRLAVADQPHWDAVNYEEVCQGARNLLKKAGLPGDLIQVASSSAAARCYNDETIQYVHIDGSHREWDAVEDLILWSRRLASGGYLLLDDTHWPSLKPALELLKYGDLLFVETLTDPRPNCPGETQVWRKP